MSSARDSVNDCASRDRLEELTSWARVQPCPAILM
jgi:hypothetical protein